MIGAGELKPNILVRVLNVMFEEPSVTTSERASKTAVCPVVI
jgi:hypothetical protein